MAVCFIASSKTLSYKQAIRAALAMVRVCVRVLCARGGFGHAQQQTNACCLWRLAGGQSIWGEDFAKEFHSRLRFSHRGLVAMAGSADGNQSQFFITLAATPQLNQQHTIFGKLTGNAIYNILQVNELELDGDRPVAPPRILTCVFWSRSARADGGGGGAQRRRTGESV